MTDSEIRAAIDDEIMSIVYNLVATSYNANYFDQVAEENTAELVALLKAQLTAERTAIKAALPEKLNSTGIAQTPQSRSREYGFNTAIDQVTQVIDGREGV